MLDSVLTQRVVCFECVRPLEPFPEILWTFSDWWCNLTHLTYLMADPIFPRRIDRYSLTFCVQIGNDILKMENLFWARFFFFKTILRQLKAHLQAKRSTNANNNFFPRVIYCYEERRNPNVHVKGSVDDLNIIRLYLLLQSCVITFTTIVLNNNGRIFFWRCTARKAATPVMPSV